ncbi:MAG: hypothetical protein JNL11_09915 [Bdellovibrionaceae bacterium]|nr:hypothetical protein [Pseudobdellovibrionaceae bacterium]
MRILKVSVIARTTVKDQDGKYSANYIENEDVKKVDGSIHTQQVIKKIKSLVELPIGEIEAEVKPYAFKSEKGEVISGETIIKLLSSKK